MNKKQKICIKKRMLLFISAMIIALMTSFVPIKNNIEAKNKTNKNDAIEIALKHANIKQEDVDNIKVKRDYDDNVYEYEVKFTYKNKKYDYTIEETSGEITEYEVKKVKNKKTKNKISKSKALEIALSHANLKESQITLTKSKLDTDDGNTKYEIEFIYGQYEYDYEIDAITGEILDYSKEIDDSIKPNNTTKITKNKALEIALSHANLKESQITLVKNKLDNDDGNTKYEIEFIYGQYEYDYEIDAVTGEILDYERDIDD